MEELKIKNAKKYVEKILLDAAQMLKSFAYLTPVGPAQELIVRTIKTLCGDEVTKIYDVEFITDAGGNELNVQVYTGRLDAARGNVAYLIPFKAFVKVQQNKNPEKIMNRFSAHKREV